METEVKIGPAMWWAALSASVTSVTFKRHLPEPLHGSQPPENREQGDRYPHNSEEQLINHIIKVPTA